MGSNTDIRQKNRSFRFAAIAVLIVAIIMVLGTLWMGTSAGRSTEKAVSNVSLFYLDELAGRREQVVAANLENSISNIRIAVGLLDDEDLSDMEHLQAYQARMKQLYGLEKFAFVDSKGLIYTSQGTQDDIDQYQFDYRTLSEPEISIKNLDADEKSVIIAVPIDSISFMGEELKICFMEISMENMLNGVSLKVQDDGPTFCNIYTGDGYSLANVVLGGLSSDDNLLTALSEANFEEGYSYDQIVSDFKEGKEGVVSFTYNDTKETIAYIPVEGTDWMLTYLIRESLISEQISTISNGVIKRSVVQTLLTALALALLFVYIMRQNKRNAELVLENEKAQQDSMITALASDYKSVYFIDLEKDEGICVRSDERLKGGLKQGESFSYLKSFENYAELNVSEDYRQSYINFIQPEKIKEGLRKEKIIAFRYLSTRHGDEAYEMLRITAVGDNENHIVAGFTDVDAEVREDMAKNQALSDALSSAEEANKAKTAFLSNMSHEIRTPMNAIIGLDNIALNDPDLSDKTRDHLEKIGDSANHLLNIINDILDMSRIESGRMVLKNEEFSLPKLLEQINTIISGQSQEKGIDYNCRVNGHVDDYYIGDNIKLKQIIINILGNAVKFTPEGGSIDFIVEPVARFDSRTTFRLTMKDTGIGMEESFLPKIFNAFAQEDSSSTNKYGSSGLGMAITKNIVDLMNGDIEVESKKGEGTTFTVTVTLLDSERNADETDDEEIAPNDISVLVIDDDDVACEHARLILSKAGISAEIAMSGKEAIEMVKLRHARREPYNLILVDWKMPDMDGVETTKRIRSIIGDESAIIILTAYKWDDVYDEATKAGVDSFLAKPLFASNVLDEFSKAIKKKHITFTNGGEKADLKGKRILIAEDVPINAEIIIMLLTMRDIQVDHAENGKIACEMFESHPENYYDAILMDMRMPEMDGLTATKTIRDMDRYDAKTVPIIALTANAFDEDVQRSLQAGLNAHLSKPVDPENLFSTLESLIKQ